MFDLHKRVASVVARIETSDECYCRVCGNTYPEDWHEGEEGPHDHDTWTCPVCGDDDTTSWDAVEFLDDALEHYFMMDQNGNYIGAVITKCCNGPTIEIHTNRSVVIGMHAGNRIECFYTDKLDLHGMLEHQFNAAKRY